MNALELLWIDQLCAPDLAALFTAWRMMLEREKRVSPHTLRAYESDLRQFFTFLQNHVGGQLTIAALAGLEIRDFRSWLAAHAKDGMLSQSRARHVASVRNFFKWADKNGHFHNACLEVLSTPKRPHKEPRPLIEHDVFALIDSLHIETWMDARDKALLMLLYGSGLRIAEALGVRRSDMHEDTIRVTGKGSKQREVPLLPPARAAIDAYLAVRPFATDWVFIGEKGNVLNQGMAQKRVRALRTELNLPDTVTPHALRHSYATHLLGAGLNLREVQHLLGHASLSTTQRYTEVDYAKMLEIFKAAHPRAQRES